MGPSPRRNNSSRGCVMENRGREILVGLMVPIALLAILSSSCMFAGRQRVDTVVLPITGDALGITICNGNRPLVVIRSGLDKGSVIRVLQHEEIHVSQMRRYSRCKDFASLYTKSADFRLKMELEAYCPEARAMSLVSEKDSVARYLSIHLVRTTGTMKTIPTVEKMVRGCLE